MMNWNNLKTEFAKQKRLHTWLIPFAFTLLICLWQLYNNHDATAADLAIGYTFSFYELPLLNCILMPIMLAVIASRLCDMEIKGDTLKLLLTLENKKEFYSDKLIHETFYLFLFVFGESISIPLIGYFYHYTEKLTFLSLFRHAAITFLVGFVVLHLQHFLSLTFQNQIIPLFVGLCSSFLGLFSMFFPPQVANLILWNYFGGFATSIMNWDETTRAIWFTPTDFPILKFVLFLVFGVFMSGILTLLFQKQEV